MNSDTVWKVVSIICLSALIGGAVERGVFSAPAASDKDMVGVVQRLDSVSNRLEDLSQRLSNVEGKLDVALDQRRGEPRMK